MICVDVDTYLQAYVDGELAGVDREMIERHLVACPSCATRVRLEARFKAAVRAHLPRPVVPVAAALVLLVAITGTVRQSQSGLLQQAQRSYRAEMPMDITGSDCGSIAS